MTHFTKTLGRTARRLTRLAVPLLVATTGTAAAMGGGHSGGSMMGGGWGLFGGTAGLLGLLWMGVLVAIPLYLAVTLGRRQDGETGERPLAVLRERYARGELSAEEFERRREQLERTR